MPVRSCCVWEGKVSAISPCNISSTQALYCRRLYCLFSDVQGQVKCEDNGERILYVDRQELSIVKLVS